MTLADRLRAGDQRDGAIGLETNLHVFGRQAAGALDVADDADTALPAPRVGLRSACREPGKVGCVDRGVEVAAKIATVHREVQRVGHRRGADEVAPAQFDAVETTLPSRFVDQALDDVAGLSEAGPARDADRRGVGQRRANVQ